MTNQFPIKKFIFLYLIGCACILLSIFSSEITPYGRDYSEYLYAYGNIDNVRFEFLFKQLFNFGQEYLKLNLNIFLIFVIFSTLSIKVYVAQKLSLDITKFLLFFFSYILTFFLLHEMVQFRISIALSLVLLSCYTLCQGRFYLSLVLVLLGSYFHLSVILFFVLPVTYFYYRKFGFTHYIIISSVVAAFLFFVVPKLTDLILGVRPSALGYLENWNNYEVVYISLSTSIIYCYLLFGFILTKSARSENQNICFIYAYFSLLIALVFSFIPEVAIRYFDICAAISLYLFVVVKEKLNLSYILFLLFYLLLVSYRIVGFIFYKPLFVF